MRHKVKWIPFFKLLLFAVITAEWGVSNDNKRCESVNLLASFSIHFSQGGSCLA